MYIRNLLHTTEGCIYNIILITNRKSYISFRLVSKSVTLNDLERCNMALILRYFTKFVYDDVVKQLIGLHRFQNHFKIMYHSASVGLKRINICLVVTVLAITVADLGIDGRGAPPKVWTLPRIGGLGAVPPAGVQGQSPRWGPGGEAPPEAEA